MFSPEAIIATGHNQGAVSVEMNLSAKQINIMLTVLIIHLKHQLILRMKRNLQQRQGQNVLEVFSNISQSSRPISLHSHQTESRKKNPTLFISFQNRWNISASEEKAFKFVWIPCGFCFKHLTHRP